MTTRRRPPSEISRTSRFGVYLEETTRKALLKAAIDEGISATELVERLIQGYLRKRRKG